MGDPTAKREQEPTPPYIFRAFPSCRYHKTEPPRMVNSPEEDAALGPGWVHNPQELGDAKAEQVEEKKVDPALEQHAMDEDVLVKKIRRSNNRNWINETSLYEKVNPAGRREAVMEAIAARITRLDALAAKKRK